MTIGIDPFVYKIMAVVSIVVVVSLMLFIWKYTAPKTDEPQEEEIEDQPKKKGRQNKKKPEEKDEAV